MVGSGIIKMGAVLSWEGIQYCGTSGFKVFLCLQTHMYKEAPLLHGHVGHACVVCHRIEHLRARVYESEGRTPAPSLSYLFGTHTCL